ncbi:MAG: hypothetical protein QW279_11410 [Candidatus Jordarchaeaceae archaeon]
MDKMKMDDFLLMLLDASNGRIESETRIQKLTFLGIKEKGLPKVTQFVWEKYGPLSKDLWKTLRRMKNQGLLRIDEEERFTFIGDCYTVRVFELTDEGRLRALELKGKFFNYFDVMQKLCYEYGKLPLDRLLEYVHTVYSPKDL